MTAEEWKKVEQALSYPYGSAKLRCDGCLITAQVQATKPLRYQVTVFVDGEWRGRWFKAEPPIDEHRFMNPRTRSFYPPSEIQKLRKLYSTKQLRQMAAKKHRWFEPSFPTAAAVRRRLQSQCKQIELLSTSLDGFEPAAAPAAKEAA